MQTNRNQFFTINIEELTSLEGNSLVLSRILQTIIEGFSRKNVVNCNVDCIPWVDELDECERILYISPSHTLVSSPKPLAFKDENDKSMPVVKPRQFVIGNEISKGATAVTYDVPGKLKYENNTTVPHYQRYDKKHPTLAKKIIINPAKHITIGDAFSEYEMLAETPHSRPKSIVVEHNEKGNIISVYIIMKKFKGMTLSKFLDEVKSGARNLTQKQRIKLSYQVAVAVRDQVHDAGLVHRDIKPDNLIVDPDTLKIKVIDYGQSQFEGVDDQMLCGTLGYLSPESALRKPPMDRSSDAYMVGETIMKIWNALDKVEEYEQEIQQLKKTTTEYLIYLERKFAAPQTDLEASFENTPELNDYNPIRYTVLKRFQGKSLFEILRDSNYVSSLTYDERAHLALSFIAAVKRYTSMGKQTSHLRLRHFIIDKTLHMTIDENNTRDAEHDQDESRLLTPTQAERTDINQVDKILKTILHAFGNNWPEIEETMLELDLTQDKILQYVQTQFESNPKPCKEHFLGLFEEIPDLTDNCRDLITSVGMGLTAANKKNRMSIDRCIAELGKFMFNEELSAYPQNLRASVERSYNIAIAMNEQLRQLKIDKQPVNKLLRLQQIISGAIDRLPMEPTAINVFVETSGIKAFKGLNNKKKLKEKTEHVLHQFVDQTSRLLNIMATLEISHSIAKLTQTAPNQNMQLSINALLNDTASLLSKSNSRTVTLNNIDSLNRRYEQKLSVIEQQYSCLLSTYAEDKSLGLNSKYAALMQRLTRKEPYHNNTALNKIAHEIRAAMLEYVLETMTKRNILAADRAASDERIKNMNQTLDTLENLNNYNNKTKLCKRVNEGLSSFKRIGFFGNSLLKNKIATVIQRQNSKSHRSCC